MKIPVLLCLYVSISLYACPAGQATAELDGEQVQGASSSPTLAPSPTTSRFSPVQTQEGHHHHWHLGNPLKRIFPHHQQHPAFSVPPATPITTPTPVPSQNPYQSSLGTAKTDEKEILKISMPPEVSGNTLPHIPVSPPPPGQRVFPYGQVQDNGFLYKPPLSWRLTARQLFTGKTDPAKDLIFSFQTDSGKLFDLISENSNSMGLALRGSSREAGQILLSFVDGDKTRSCVIAIKDDSASGSAVLRARILPYSTKTSTSLLNLFFTRIKSAVEMRDML